MTPVSILIEQSLKYLKCLRKNMLEKSLAALPYSSNCCRCFWLKILFNIFRIISHRVSVVSTFWEIEQNLFCKETCITMSSYRLQGCSFRVWISRMLAFIWTKVRFLLVNNSGFLIMYTILYFDFILTHKPGWISF